MALMRFLNKYREVKQEKVGNSIMQAIVNWDMDGAAEADVRVMESNLDELVQDVTKQVREVKRERAEADAINALYNEKLAAIEVLEGRKAGADEATIAEIDAVILEEVANLEAMQPDIERENQEAVEAEEYLKELEDMAKLGAEKLKTIRSTLEKKKTDLKRAKLQTQREEEKLERKRQLAGLSSDMSKLHTALSAMDAQTAEEQDKANTMKLKSKLIGDDAPKNSLMAEAMAAVKGKSTGAATTSVSDRLAALKAKAK